MGRRSRRVQIERHRRDRWREVTDAGRLRVGLGCLFCRRTDESFTSREHILPESLGNSELLLERGVVCDACNNGPLAAAEKDFCEFFPIKAIRTMTGVPSKKGKYPELLLATGTMRHTGDLLQIFQTDPDGTPILSEAARNGEAVELKIEIGSRSPVVERVARRVSATLLKAALECATQDAPELAYSPALDHVRRRALGESGPGVVLVRSKGGSFKEPLHLSYDFVMRDGQVGVRVALDYRGLLVVTHSFIAAPERHVPSDVALVFSFC